MSLLDDKNKERFVRIRGSNYNKGPYSVELPPRPRFPYHVTFDIVAEHHDIHSPHYDPSIPDTSLDWDVLSVQVDGIPQFIETFDVWVDEAGRDRIVHALVQLLHGA